MRGIVAGHGLASLMAPVRPTEKHRYPLILMEHYASWRRADGSLFDPWLRTHERVGGVGAGVAPASMTIRGSVAEWEEWTGLPMPETGSYVVPGALVPVEIDRERDVGLYVEPNYWWSTGHADPDPQTRDPHRPLSSLHDVRLWRTSGPVYRPVRICGRLLTRGPCPRPAAP